MSSTNGTTHDNGHSADVDIDTLYSFGHSRRFG
jgi:hypothetical protein